MKTKLFLLLTMFIVTITFLGCGSEDDPVEINGRIFGVVTESGSNIPIQFAEVSLPDISKTYKTGKDGKYAIDDLAEKNYTVTVNKEGYISSTKKIIVKGGSSISLNFSLEKEPTLKVAPEVKNLESSEVDHNSVAVNASISDVGSASVSAYGFCWGTTPNPTIADNKNNLGGTATITTFKTRISGLTAKTKYHIRAYATNEGGTAYSNPITITTLAPTTIAVVKTIEANEVTYNQVTVSGSIDDLGDGNVTAYGFCWGTTSEPTIADNKNNIGGTTTNTSFKSIISGLTAETQYYIRAYAINNVGIAYGNSIAIKTLSMPTMASVRTLSIKEVAYNEITINGNIDDLGDGYVTAYGFCYSKDNSTPTLEDSSISLGATKSTGVFTDKITGLEQQTKYFIRAYATNSKGTSYGEIVEAITPIAPPLVTSGLLAYYTFDDENCDDYLGEDNYNGILQGDGNEPTFTSYTPSADGKSLKFAKGKYYYLTMAPGESATQYSYAVWIKTKDTGYVYMNNKRRISLFYNKVGYSNHSVTNAVRYEYFFDIDLSTILYDGEWHHVVVTWKQFSERRLYIDGRFYKKVDKDVSISLSYGGPSAVIGKDYMGSMDNLRIYNRVITEDEISEIYNAKQ